MTIEATRIHTDHPFKKYWTPDDSCCEICGRQFDGGVPEADMYHYAERYAHLESVVCHERCGRSRGMERA